MRRVPQKLTEFARELRAEMTDAERKLWRHLKAEQLGVKFRRQHPIGRCIADFACLEHKVVVELDGGQHAEAAADAQRDAWMQMEGWRVLRFWNTDVMKNVEGVVEVIASVVAAPPSQPSPCQGEGANSPPSPGQGEGRGGGRT